MNKSSDLNSSLFWRNAKIPYVAEFGTDISGPHSIGRSAPRGAPTAFWRPTSRSSAIRLQLCSTPEKTKSKHAINFYQLLSSVIVSRRIPT
jgi:hypothetical protein